MTARPLANRAWCRVSVRGHDNVLETEKAVLRRVRIHVRGSGNQILIAPQARVSNVVISMEGSGHRLEIGGDVGIHAGEFRFFDDGCTIEIGERTTIYDAAFGATEAGSITVGDDCLLSKGIDVRNGDSHSIVDATSGERLNVAEDVHLAAHVWVGARAMILKGSRIGAHAVVGAGSIVSGPVPEGTVAVGIPARQIASGVTWLRTRV